jgi:two-component system OmpR family response regulator
MQWSLRGRLTLADDRPAMLDTFISGVGAAGSSPAAVPTRTAPALERAPRRAATALVLFVGEAVRPGSELGALLARDGVRALCLPGVEQALRAAELARFDALLVDGALVDGPGARALARLAEVHACPVVVLGEQADEVNEIVTLELGADLYLARPLTTRRLRANLAALLRRRAAR